MTRKRAQPDTKRRKPKRKKSLTGRLIRIAGTLIARHPSVAGGSTAFLVIFSFVSANAIWYQPGAHPDPLFSTRNRLAHMARAKVADAQPVAKAMTVGDVIARASAGSSSAATAAKPDVAETGSIPAPAVAAAAPGSQGSLVHDIQAALAARNFYDGPVDGTFSRRTQAAIEAFQAATASPLTGKPSADLLARIDATHRHAVAIPRSRPGDQPFASDDEIATVVNASAPADVPVPKPVPAVARTNGRVPSHLVERIQAGLRNIAYSDVAVDGIAGTKTRQAILNFEKNYRLPQDGEPNAQVLKKLIAIGAL